MLGKNKKEINEGFPIFMSQIREVSCFIIHHSRSIQGSESIIYVSKKFQMKEHLKIPPCIYYPMTTHHLQTRKPTPLTTDPPPY